MENLVKPQKKSILKVFLKFLGLFIEFITFNLLNSLIFYFLWLRQNPLALIAYFVLLYFVIKFELYMSKLFISRYVDVTPAIVILTEKTKFMFFSVVYFGAYLGARYNITDSWVVSYTTTCLVPYFIGWLVYRRKAKKILETIKPLDQKVI